MQLSSFSFLRGGIFQHERYQAAVEGNWEQSGRLCQERWKKRELKAVANSLALQRPEPNTTQVTQMISEHTRGHVLWQRRNVKRGMITISGIKKGGVGLKDLEEMRQPIFSVKGCYET